MDQHSFSVVLCILANGRKLPSMIVFKGKPNATLEKRLQNFIKENNYNIKLYCHEKGWVDKILFEKWLTEIWFINYSFKPANNTVLILDQATAHSFENLEYIFEKNNSKYILIPK